MQEREYALDQYLPRGSPMEETRCGRPWTRLRSRFDPPAARGQQGPARLFCPLTSTPQARHHVARSGTSSWPMCRKPATTSKPGRNSVWPHGPHNDHDLHPRLEPES